MALESFNLSLKGGVVFQRANNRSVCLWLACDLERKERREYQLNTLKVELAFHNGHSVPSANCIES